MVTKPMCATEEYAISFFMSSCTSATSEVYTMAITESVKINGARSIEACGNMGNEKRRKPYPPIFSRIAARITEPAVGASTCASGSQVCTGHIGIFTAKDAKKASHSQVCMPCGNANFISVGMSVVFACQYIAVIASSISTEPSNV